MQKGRELWGGRKVLPTEGTAKALKAAECTVSQNLKEGQSRMSTMA